MKYILMILSASFLVLACKKSGTGETAVIELAKAILISPALNEACTEGKVISKNESTVTFKWNGAANAEFYELVVKNLLNGKIEYHDVSGITKALNLARNTPFSWYVVSKTSKNSMITKSDVWLFFNSGEGIVSHAPFPADELKPVMNAEVSAVNGRIKLSWVAKDVDDDIKDFDVYLGTNIANLVISKTENRCWEAEVNANTNYYWKVVTKDLKGNQSDSGIHSFHVN